MSRRKPAPITRLPVLQKFLRERDDRKKRHIVVNEFTNDEIRAIADLARQALEIGTSKYPCPIDASPGTMRKVMKYLSGMKPYRKTLRALADRKASLVSKRRLLANKAQVGGFLTSLLNPLIAAVVSSLLFSG